MWDKSFVNRWLRRWRVAGHSSPLFTTLHPDFFLRMRDLLLNQASVFSLQWWPASVFNNGWLRSSMVTGFVKSGEEWWRVVKSGEECTATLHLSEPQCLSGFQAVWWRVKSKSESSLFLSSSLFFFLVASPSSSRRVVSCLAMARNCPGKGQYCAIARQYTLRASLPPASTIVATFRWRPGTS